MKYEFGGKVEEEEKDLGLAVWVDFEY